MAEVQRVERDNVARMLRDIDELVRRQMADQRVNVMVHGDNAPPWPRVKENKA